jgi:hypothetical protein
VTGATNGRTPMAIPYKKEYRGVNQRDS